MIRADLEDYKLAKRVDLDAMIPREDFAVAQETHNTELRSDFPISLLEADSPFRKLLRKPDFQRETNHWTPEQFVSLIASFVDNEVIPSLIFWKAPLYIFVIDGGHRLSALRAWMEDDYGDGVISTSFFSGKEIPKTQRDIAVRTRKLVEAKVGRYSRLRAQLDSHSGSETERQRAQNLFTRALSLQWIQGSASVAETSFFKINSQGTPLDETETLLIKNRRKPVAIGARAILRAGSGHKYWSTFTPPRIAEVEHTTQLFHERIFKPEAEEPLKTLELPLGGSVSPVDALGLLIEFLGIAGSKEPGGKPIEKYDNDETGEATVLVLKNAFHVLNRMSGNEAGSLGLHPAVYFYNERGKYNRFLFLGMVLLIQDKIKNNDSHWFKLFTDARRKMEDFLLEHKSLIALVLQNLSKGQRVPKMRDMFGFLVKEICVGNEVTFESAIGHLGISGRLIDVQVKQTTPRITDETKSALHFREAIETALHCPICGGMLDPRKSVSYDHIIPRRDGGTGDISNVQRVHPYCNTGYKESGSQHYEV
jgi:hypothetical protein